MSIPASRLFEHERHRALNTVHTWLLAGGSLALLTVTAYVFGGLFGVIVALIFGAISIRLVQRVSPKMVLSMYKARPVSRASFPEGAAMVDELARRAGLERVPQLYVVPSAMMNAFAVGSREEAAIAITDGLARRLTLRELAGVLAHEMSHIAHNDLRVMAFADMVSRYTSVMSTIGILSLFFNILGSAGGYAAPIPWLAALTLIVAPTIGGLLQLALSRTREFDADLGAALLTGDPDGLAMALTKLERAHRGMWETLILPGGRSPAPSILRSHPPTQERLERLAALRPQGASTQLAARTDAPRRRASFVPQVRRMPWGNGIVDDFDAMSAMPSEPMAVPGGTDRTARAEGLCEPEGRPRIRLRRGGVWW